MEFIDVPAQYRRLKSEIDKEIQSVLDSGHFIHGPAVAAFEQEFAAYLGVKHVVACGNGTDALQLLYMAYGVKKGDTVFAPDMTFIATHESACMLGAEPVFCDIDPNTANLSPESLEQRIEKVKQEGRLKPRFVVGVDYLGTPCDWEALTEIAQRYGLILIEDAAQSTGGRYGGKPCGSFGHAAATSFFPTKPLACFGDGGAVMTNDDGLDEVLRSLRMHGKGSSKYDNVRVGVNSRLDTLQAAVLRVKLRHLEEENALRQQVAQRYDEAFDGLLQRPSAPAGARQAWAQYAVLAKDESTRTAIIAALEGQGIPTLIYYPTPQHALPVFADFPSANMRFPHAEHYAKTSVCLPFSPYLAPEDQRRVIEAVKRVVDRG